MGGSNPRIKTLSGYLVTGALAALGAQAVVATLVTDRRDHLTAFYIVSSVAMGSLTLSIYVGGRLNSLFEVRRIRYFEVRLGRLLKRRFPKRRQMQIYTGLDLSRKRLDWQALSADGTIVDAGAAPPDKP